MVKRFLHICDVVNYGSLHLIIVSITDKQFYLHNLLIGTFLRKFYDHKEMTQKLFPVNDYPAIEVTSVLSIPGLHSTSFTGPKVTQNPAGINQVGVQV